MKNDNLKILNNQEQEYKAAGSDRAQVTSTTDPGVFFDVTLSKAHIRPFITFRSGSSILKSSKGEKFPRVGGGQRGRINGFSRQSRYRLMQTIAGVRRDAELPKFITLTYPAEFPTVKDAKRDLKVMSQRLDRKYKNAGYIWKLEPQERGAPHYHLLMWGADDSLLDFVAQNWYEIAGKNDRNALLFLYGLLKGSKPCVTDVNSWRGVWSYASKYLGKTFEVAEWGSKWTGRFWGVRNRQNIPFGEEITLPVSKKDVVQLMRYQRRFSKMKRYGNSLTIFCDADQWVSRLVIPKIE